jgi:mono/diheme cytochrome c family protein
VQSNNQKQMKNIKYTLFAFVAVVVLYSCGPADGNHTGTEYMPDMGHSIAQEANVFTYYYYNTWDSASTIRLKELAVPGLPAEGTVPRGYAATQYAGSQGKTMKEVMGELNGDDAVNSISVPVNGHVPYYYEDTEADRTRATAELLDNPFPITTDGLARGEDLYNKFCGICHGEKGDGVGYLVSEDNPNAVYPAAPANFLLEDLGNASNGRYYHAIMYGKNVMGGYADKISYEERWQVIHWIRALQAKDKKVDYSAELNTLNPAFGTPMAQVKQLAEEMEEVAPATGDSGSDDHSDDGHHDTDSHDHKGGDHSSDDHSHGKK